MIELTNNEKKGLDLTVKGLAKTYPFVKFGGLSAGGTEKYLQTLAVNLRNHMGILYMV